MNFKVCTIVLAFTLFAFVLTAGAEQYVTNTAANTELHTIENTWNHLYLNTTSDYTGSLAGFSQTGTSANGTITVTLKVSNVGYTLDFGELGFSALNPIQETKCAYTEHVNKFEMAGSGSISVKTPTGQLSYSCTSVKMGIKNFALSGNVSVGSGGALAFSNGIAVVDSQDYYFSYNCSPSAGFGVVDLSSADTVPSQYRTILATALRKPTSNLTTKTVATSRTKMKTSMTQFGQ
jgi:hypothetical protein